MSSVPKRAAYLETFQGISVLFFFFFKKCAHQGCIYLIQSTFLNNCFTFEQQTNSADSEQSA